MKKMLSMIFGSVLCLSMLTACGGEEATPSTTTGGGTTGTSGSTETAQETTPVEQGDLSELSADVQEIVDRGVLRVGVKNNVMGFGIIDILTSEYSGMEIDLAQNIASYLGVDIEYTAVTAATRTELLDSGDLDCVVATFTITDERKESWSFTTPYYVDAVTALVTTASGITDLSGIVDTTVGVSSGSNSARAMVAAMIEADLIDGSSFDASTFDPSTWTEGVSFRQYEDYPAISTALEATEIDAFCVDKSILAIYNSDSRTFIEDTFAPQDYGVATSKDTGFSELCEELVTTWLADGTIDALIAKHNIQ